MIVRMLSPLDKDLLVGRTSLPQRRFVCARVVFVRVRSFLRAGRGGRRAWGARGPRLLPEEKMDQNGFSWGEATTKKKEEKKPQRPRQPNAHATQRNGRSEKENTGKRPAHAGDETLYVRGGVCWPPAHGQSQQERETTHKQMYVCM